MASSRALAQTWKRTALNHLKSPSIRDPPSRNTAVNMHSSVDIHTRNNTSLAYFTANRSEKQQQEFSGTLPDRLCASFSPKGEASLWAPLPKPAQDRTEIGPQARPANLTMARKPKDGQKNHWGHSPAPLSSPTQVRNINNIPAHCNQILTQKAMECAIICQASF